jgi:putative ABC transport system permease protein
MASLALRNLFHDKIRLAVTVIGVQFAVVLIVVELGLFFGFTETTATVIHNSKADLWVASTNVPYLELGVPFNERKLYQVKAVPGVADAEKIIIRGTRWNRPDGAQEAIQIVGFNPDGGMGGPWNLVQGSVRDLQIPGGVILDELYKKKLGVTRIGEEFEINGHRARVVGFTHGIRSFTTSPYVFTAFKNAQDYAPMREDQTIFVLVKTEPGVSLDAVRRDILSHVKDVTVLTTPEFSQRTQHYWTYTTGAGLAMLAAAVLGLIVGFVVVAQTIYATTMDHLKDFGTLKAIGAPNSYVYKVILTQAAIAAVIGSLLGMVIGGLVVRFSELTGVTIVMNWQIAVGTFFVTLLMCTGAALISINKVTQLDPAMVFKG